jgi:hypothetical protein
MSAPAMFSENPTKFWKVAIGSVLPISNYPNGNTANTHFQENSDNIIAKLVIDGIKASSASEMRLLVFYLK